MKIVKILMLALAVQQAVPSYSFANEVGISAERYDDIVESLRSDAKEIATRNSSASRQDRERFLEKTRIAYASMSSEQKSQLIDALIYRLNFTENTMFARANDTESLKLRWSVILAIAIVFAVSADTSGRGFVLSLAGGLTVSTLSLYNINKATVDESRDRVTLDNIRELKKGLVKIRESLSKENRAAELEDQVQELK